MLNPTVLGFKRGTMGIAFIFVTLVNKQKGFRTQKFNTSITGFITTKIIINFRSSILLPSEEMCQAFFKH